MKYKEHIGKIYDTIYYGVIYFNKPSVIKKFEERGHDLDGAFSYFDEVKNSCPPLPECLLPFFYYDAVTPCFLTQHLISSLNFHTHKYNDFISSLQNSLKKNIFDYLFDNLPENERMLLIQKKDSETVSRAFTNNLWSMEMKNQTMFLLYNFHYVPDLLTKTLNNIYKHITALHEKYKNKITQQIEETKSKENLILFEKLYSLNEKQLNRQFFSICFMNQIIRFEKKEEEERYDESVFLLGYRYKETMEVDYANKDILLEQSLIALGDPIRFRIIVNLQKHGSLTMSDMSRLIDISKSTAFKSVNILFEERVIVESHRDGKKIYYKINNDYLQSFNKLINQFVNTKGGT